MEEVPGQGPHYDASVPRHFLTGAEITNDELTRILDRALELKADRYASRALDRRTVALVFEKPSTRTRVSMEVAVAQLGGTPLVLRENETRWESLSDADRERLGVMARAVVSRLLHEPTLKLKGAVEGDTSYVYVQALRELFGLEVGSALDEPGAGAEVTSLDARRRKRS
jgi:glutamyl-tRNA reductase